MNPLDDFPESRKDPEKENDPEKIDPLDYKRPKSLEDINSVEELIKKVEKRYEKIRANISYGENWIPVYRGKPRRIGISTTENSPLSSSQFEFCLSVSDDPAINQLIKEGKRDFEDFDLDNLVLDQLIEDQPLEGVKIIDLGCGKEPLADRVMRKLGAELYTVDILSIDEIHNNVKSEMDIENLNIDKEEEAVYHIQIDLAQDSAAKEIDEKTGGNFDIVTSAHLNTGNVDTDLVGGRELAIKLLKEAGFYFDANKRRSMFAEVKGKDGLISKF